jgi:hypothetical protein
MNIFLNNISLLLLSAAKSIHVKKNKMKQKKTKNFVQMAEILIFYLLSNG